MLGHTVFFFDSERNKTFRRDLTVTQKTNLSSDFLSPFYCEGAGPEGCDLHIICTSSTGVQQRAKTDQKAEIYMDKIFQHFIFLLQW